MVSLDRKNDLSGWISTCRNVMKVQSDGYLKGKLYTGRQLRMQYITKNKAKFFPFVLTHLHVFFGLCLSVYKQGLFRKVCINLLEKQPARQTYFRLSPLVVVLLCKKAIWFTVVELKSAGQLGYS